MHPDDLARLQIGEHDAVRVTSGRGSVEMKAEADPDLAVGTCFFPEHFNQPPVKDLTECVTDPVTSVPSFKLTRVTIEKLKGTRA